MADRTPEEQDVLLQQTLATGEPAGRVAVEPLPEPAKELPALLPRKKPHPGVTSEQALLAAVAMRKEAQFEAFRQLYESKGRIAEFDNYKRLLMEAEEPQVQQRIFDRARALAEANGFSPDVIYDPSDPSLLQSVAEEIQFKEQSKLHDAFRAAINTMGADRMPATLPQEELDQHNETRLTPGAILANELRFGQEAEIMLLDAHREYNVKRAPDGSVRGAKMGSPWEAIGGILFELVPGIDMKLRLDIQKGLAEQVNQVGDKQFLPGEVAEKLREWYVKLPIGGKRKFIENYVKLMQDSNVSLTDMKMWLTTAVIFTPQLLNNLDPDDTLFDVIDNLAGIADLVALGAIAKKFLRPGVKLALNPALRAIKAANRFRATQVLAELTAKLDTAAFKNVWSLDKEDILLTQLPRPEVRPGALIDDMPDFIQSAEYERILTLRGELNDIVGRSFNLQYTADEALSVIEEQAQALELAHKGKLRPGMSTVVLHENGGGATFKSVVGLNERRGFGTLNTALKHAEDIEPDLTGIVIYRKNADGDFVPFLTGKEALDVPPGQLKKRGAYLIEHQLDTFYQPTDKLLFNADAVKAPAWLGRAAGYVTTPSANLDAAIYKPFLGNFLRSAATANILDDIVRPLGKMRFKDRRAINEIYAFTEEFGRKEGKIPTMDVIMEKFPEITPKQQQGYWVMKEFYDAVYHVQNDRLYRDWLSRGFKTVRKGSAHYEGRPLEVAELSRLSRRTTFYDPETQKARSLSTAERKDLLRNGGSVIETELPVSVRGDTQFTLIISDPSAGWKQIALTRRPLQYIEGYYPRLYKDPIHIKRSFSKGTLNGQPGKLSETLRMARSTKEADRYIAKLKAQHPDWELLPIEDARLTSLDRASSDLQRMKVQGRIFFDDRNTKRLIDTEGNLAEIFDPMEMLERTSRIVSKQVSMEDMLRGQKQAWVNTFGDLLPPSRTIENTTSLRIRDLLREQLNKATGAATKRPRDALIVWDHIRLMGGTVDDSSKIFKKLAIHSAEWVDHVLGKFPGAVGRASHYLSRNAGAKSLGDRMKNLAFLDFIIARPFRQLVLQSMQHAFLQALDPLYAGRWQLDSILLLHGVKARNATLAGMNKLHLSTIKRNAALMRLSEDEYLRLLKEFNDSGLVQNVNLHSFAGDVSAPPRVAKTVIGNAAIKTGRAFRKPFDLAQKYGFDTGEGINVSSSYMMAVKRHMKEVKKKSLMELSREEWNKIGTRGSDYALAMVRPNQARFQKGLLSVPLQFMQFTHKALLTMLRAVPGPIGRLGNKAFTQSEAMKIVIGQFVLFGGAGFGIKETVQDMLSSAGMDHYLNTEVQDLIEGGLVDWMLDGSLQYLFDDPDLDLAFDEFLAPGANVFNLGKRVIEIAWENGDLADFIGPVGVTGSRIWEAYNVASVAWKDPNPGASSEQRLAEYLDIMLAGVFSNYSDWVRARAAARTGVWLGKHGQRTDLEATWAAVQAKQFLGLNEQAKLDGYRLRKDAGDHVKELKGAGRDYFNRYRQLTRLHRDGSVDRDEYQRLVNFELRAIMYTFDEGDRMVIHEEFVRLLKADQAGRDSISDWLAEMIVSDGVDLDALRGRIARSPAIREEDRPYLLKMIENATDQTAAGDPALLRGIQAEVERAEQLRLQEELRKQQNGS